jgi:MFS family permease
MKATHRALPVQGLRENAWAFALLVGVNALVGGMVGMERVVLPELAGELGVATAAAATSFLVAFGLAKSAANLLMGRLANHVGRKNLLLAGWALAVPVPWMLLGAESWTGVVAANVLLGASQGLAWSSTVVMKMDLVGRRQRGLAMGLNEFAGYAAVGLVALWTGHLAATHGLKPWPFYLGGAMSVLGLGLSVLFVKDTAPWSALEAYEEATRDPISSTGGRSNLFAQTTWRNPTLSAVTQAGFVNNLNDGMMWGLMPMYLVSEGLNLQAVGWVAGVYPVVWGVGQIGAGRLGDRMSKKRLIVAGMALQGAVLLAFPAAGDELFWTVLAGLLGLGTALVYPNFLTAVADATRAEERAESVGVFRFWRDMGYVAGALVSGVLADAFGFEAAIAAVGAATLASAAVVQARMRPEVGSAGGPV